MYGRIKYWIQVFLVVLMSGLSGVISYYFQGKFRLLLTAEGKKYIITGINTVTHVGVSIFKAVVLLAGGSVAAVVVTAVFICTNWMFNRDAAKIAVQYISRNVKERLKKHDA